MTERKHAPVFIVGSARSGTTLLYHMLLSAGGFAYYRAETRVFDVIVPRFRDLGSRAVKEQMMELWLGSHLYRRSGLDAKEIKAKVLAGCRDGGDFLRIVMGGIAARQGVARWADCTPTHVLHLAEIKAAIPDAVFLHIIRDGRDVALSLQKAGWISPFPWDTKRSLLVAGLRWQWVVGKGRQGGRALGPDYMEVRFEDLVARPRDTLSDVGAFIDHDLDYDQILRHAVGSVKRPNTAFVNDAEGGRFNPVGRWKERFSEDELIMFESMIGKSLEQLGYELGTDPRRWRSRPELKLMGLAYRSYYSAKQWAKTRTPLGRYMTDTGVLTQDLGPPAPSGESFR